MNKEKQINEMAEAILYAGDNYDTCCKNDCETIASLIYDKGYRKASDIFEEIEKAITAKIIINGKIIYDPLISLAELKNKYEREKTK